MDEVCTKSHDTCKSDTEAMFKTQCDTLYGPASGSSDPLPEPEPVSLKGLQSFQARLDKKWRPPPKFEGMAGKELDYFYPKTCPSHHRRYEFTYYLLFSGAVKKWGVTLPNQWDENLALSLPSYSGEPGSPLVRGKGLYFDYAYCY